ncbi:MAG: anti-sigma factor family protein [Planctomycetota bacterium]
MNCTHAKRLIHLHVGDDLTHAESQLLDTHLLQCPDCRSHHSALLRPMAALHALRDAAPAPLPSIWPSVSISIRQQLSRHSNTRRFNLQIAAVSVCSLLLAVATIVQTLQSLRPTTSDLSATWTSAPVSHVPASLQPRFHGVASLTPPIPDSRRSTPPANWPHGAQDF